MSRSVELLQLAEQLRRGSLAAQPALFAAAAPPLAGGAVAPPPPLGAVAPPPPLGAVAPPLPPSAARSGAPPSGSVGPSIEVDFEEEDVEFLDDDDEVMSLDDPELEDEIPPLGFPAPEPPALASARALPSTPAAVDLPPPPFVAPFPSSPASSNLSSGPSIEFEEASLEGDDEIEFGEVEIGTQAKEAVPRSATPSVREIEPPSIDHVDSSPFDLSSPAEIAMSQRNPARYDDDIEAELGVDLSLRLDDDTSSHLPRSRTEPKPPAIPSAPAPKPPSIPYSPPPAVGLASVRPSRPPGASDRIVSAGTEPFAEAPSALAPTVEPYLSVEPPSRPSQAPPAESMRDPSFDSSAKAAHSFAETELPTSVIPAVRKDEPSAPKSAPALSSQPLSSGGPSSSRAPASSRRSSLPPKTGGTFLDGIDTMVVPGLMDLPEESLASLLASAEIHRIERGEEVSSFAVLLVTSGAVQIMPSIADATSAVARKGEVIFTSGSLPSSIDLKVVGYDPGTRVATMSRAAFDAATAECPWVVDELAEVADRFQAFAGAVMGPLGDSLDEMFRGMVLDKCTVKRPRPGDSIATKGKAVNGFYVVGGGSLDVLGPDGAVATTLSSGDFVFPETILSASPASADVKVGAQGALLLYIDRMGAHELLATCPPFIELLAGS